VDRMSIGEFARRSVRLSVLSSGGIAGLLQEHGLLAPPATAVLSAPALATERLLASPRAREGGHVR
jgi:hypothetical protein